MKARRAVPVRIAGETRFVPVEYASRYRDTRWVSPPPPGLAEVFVAESETYLCEIYHSAPLCAYPPPLHHSRYLGAIWIARHHSGYGSPWIALGLGKLLEGEFRPGGVHREWCDPDVIGRFAEKVWRACAGK